MPQVALKGESRSVIWTQTAAFPPRAHQIICREFKSLTEQQPASFPNKAEKCYSLIYGFFFAFSLIFH